MEFGLDLCDGAALGFIREWELADEPIVLVEKADFCYPIVKGQHAHIDATGKGEISAIEPVGHIYRGAGGSCHFQVESAIAGHVKNNGTLVIINGTEGDPRTGWVID